MSSPIEDLLSIMARLRDKNGGCPWDIEQDFASIAPYTLEEAYEVADAIAEGDMQGLKEELGDLLLQVVFHAQMAKEENLFDFNEVAAGIGQKLIRRHPHVFGEAEIRTAEAQTASWEAIKAEERNEKAGKQAGILDNVPKALPALTRALKLQKRAAKVGFDWASPEPVFAKLNEEVAELREALAEGASKEKLTDELGDILFVCANLARQFDIEPEEALRGTNRKFERRFRFIEQSLSAQGRTPDEASLEEMDALWDAAKKTEAAL
ncbi:MAG: nucleoside triphosphate pyrophosphohydrolase [Alphaproteobacteria bacterium]|nr:nucleoside triphosphate pyrophosphohydrolase [Alphaproteobacteria bacterium]